ncbi:kinase-like domain-containing protein [Aspergillus granulosus]|uniref:Kinase-like domain-containing protein n=1 Tax=Aspergillus granulosus TaxID=176169 RepID=A0ABR4GV84_9EURO
MDAHQANYQPQLFELEQPSNFLKHGSPFSEPSRGFIHLKSSNFDAIEVRGAAIRLVKHFRVDRDKVQVQSLRTTQHENIVNLKEVFLDQDVIFFIYDDWGIPLDRICSIFYLGEIEVATICNNVLQALVYLHEALGISHGAIQPSNILIMPDGGVKLANIGNSMIRQLGREYQYQDVLAVCYLVRSFLGIGSRGLLGCLSEDFIRPYPVLQAADLLKHPFLQFSTGKWCLRVLRELYLVSGFTDSMMLC